MRSTGQIGIVLSDLVNPVYLHFLDAVHRALVALDLRLLVLTPDPRGCVELEQVVDGALDGAILTTTKIGSSLPTSLSERQFPFVLLNREIDDCPGDVCVTDNEGGARLIGEEFIALGHSDIAAVFGPEDTSTGRDRERGFRQALTAAGRTLPPSRWRRSAWDPDAGRQATADLLAADSQPPTALFCGNDMLALGAFDALLTRGLSIPDDVSVIGFDDMTLTRWRPFRLTTVAQNIPEMARIATELLLSRIAASDDPPAPRRVVVTAEMRKRHTHGPPRDVGEKQSISAAPSVN